jgi:hypothetical protein
MPRWPPIRAKWIALSEVSTETSKQASGVSTEKRASGIRTPLVKKEEEEKKKKREKVPTTVEAIRHSPPMLVMRSW